MFQPFCSQGVFLHRPTRHGLRPFSSGVEPAACPGGLAQNVIAAAGVPLKTIAPSGDMNFSQAYLAKRRRLPGGSQGFCKSKMAEIQPPDGDESI